MPPKRVRKPRTRPARSAKWVFTDYENLDIESIYEENKDFVRGIAYGDEICPDTGRQHNQGFIQFFSEKAMTNVKRLFGSKQIHVEIMGGMLKDNEIYCSKDEKYIRLGEFRCQGQRTDIEMDKKLLDDGGTLDDLWQENFGNMLRYYKGYGQYKKSIDKVAVKKRGFRILNVKLVCGPTGTNKTRNAVEHNPDAFMITGRNLKWWDGYEQEDCLIIDEYNNDVPITELLGILDGYNLRLEIKGSFTTANWTKVIITTNLLPADIHANAKPAHRDALFRRITRVVDLWAEPGYESDEISDG